MGFTRPRDGRDGLTRYQALYDDAKGHRRSAGTFATDKAADRAWQLAEARMAEGRMGNPSRGRQRFRTYVEGEWLPNHQREARTRETYSYYLGRHILPWFGAMRMVEVMPADVREWITHLQNENVSAHVIRYCKTVLSAIFTTALNDVVHLHPVRGVKSPPVAKKPRVIVTPEQFDRLYLALPSGTMKLLVETDIESGLRWGELTELRPRDLDFSTGVLTVSRVVGAGVSIAGRLRQLPGSAAGGGPGSATPPAGGPDGRAHSAVVVPAAHLAARRRGRPAADPGEGARATPRARLLAARWGSRPPGRQGAARPFQHRHHPEVPRHPRRDRRHRDRCPQPDPQPRQEARQPRTEEVRVNLSARPGLCRRAGSVTGS
jgi:Phage integrase, N-terminal SAM-like domain